MWSATASDSSIVIGPTSRRTRPRLSSRRVLSRGSSGSRDASRSTSTAASLFGARRLPECLRPGPPLLALAASRLCGLAGSGRHPTTWDGKRFAELLDETLDRELPVARLASLVLRDGTQHSAGPCDDTPLLRLGQRRGCLDVEQGLDARGRLLRVLPAGTTRARDPQRDLRDREQDGARDPNRLTLGHGHSLSLGDVSCHVDGAPILSLERRCARQACSPLGGDWVAGPALACCGLSPSTKGTRDACRALQSLGFTYGALDPAPPPDAPPVPWAHGRPATKRPPGPRGAFLRWLRHASAGYLLDQSRLIWGDVMTGIVLSGALLFGVVIVFLLIAIRS